MRKIISAGMMEDWNTGIIRDRNAGIMEYWNIEFIHLIIFFNLPTFHHSICLIFGI